MYDQEYILGELLMIITLEVVYLVCVFGVLVSNGCRLFDIEVFVMGMRTLAVVAAV